MSNQTWWECDQCGCKMPPSAGNCSLCPPKDGVSYHLHRPAACDRPTWPHRSWATVAAAKKGRNWSVSDCNDCRGYHIDET